MTTRSRAQTKKGRRGDPPRSRPATRATLVSDPETDSPLALRPGEAMPPHLVPAAALQMQQALGNEVTAHWLQRQLILQRDSPGAAPAQYPSHPLPKSPWRTPDDEVEKKWAPAKTKLGDPLQQYSLDPGPNCPMPPNSVWEKPPSHHRRVDENPFKPALADPPILMNPWRAGERQKKWDAYRTFALQVQGLLANVAPDVDLFQHAEKDPDARALGLILPQKGWTGDLGALASSQQVPRKGGLTVGSVLGGPTKADEAGLNRAGRAMKAGKGGLEKAFHKCIEADEELKSAVDTVRGRADGVAQAAHLVNAEGAALEHFRASDAALIASAEIAKLKEEFAAIKTVISVFTELPVKLVDLAKEGVNPLTAIGGIANGVIDLVSESQLEAAKQKLAAAQQKMHDSRARELQERLEGAKVGARGQINTLSAAMHALRKSLASRRAVYNEAGTAAGAAAGRGGQSNNRVAAMLAAIPLVETVVARMRSIYSRVKDAPPAYTREAGIGYGIALYHQSWAAWDLPSALGLIQNLQLYFGWGLADWEASLGQLQSVQERLGGPRPAGNSE